MTTDKTLTKRIRRAACLVGSLLTLALTACVQDEALVLPDRPEPQAPGLHIALAPEGTEPEASTRTPGVDALNENRIGTADVFIFKHDGMLNPDGYAHGEGSGPVTVYSGSNWLDNFNEDDAPFSVYVVANYKGSATLSSVTSLDDLKAVTATDKDIVYFEGMNTGSGTFERKSFLMDGHTEVDYATLAAAPDGQVYDISVPVRRAAAKVELTLQFSDDWKTKYTPSNLLAQVVNYATVTPALADGTPQDASRLGYQSTPDKGGAAENNFTVGFVTRGANGAIEGSTVRFYAYVNRWDELVENETMLLIDLPGTYYGEDGQQQAGENYAHNFYKIPFIGNAEPQVMERNTFYQVTATVDMLGSTEIDEPVELNDVQFETADWEVDGVSVGEGDTPTYLILSSYHLELRNVDGYDDLRFYSSSPITSVEFVSGNTALNDPDVDFEFNYPGEGDDIPAIYFVNKDGKRQSVDENDPNGDGTRGDNGSDEVSKTFDSGVEGNIHLVSTSPNNVTKRYITLKVTNRDNISKYVVIEQYPLEYIQPIQGYYSYRDDFLSPDNVTPASTVVTWESEFTGTGRGTINATQRRTRESWRDDWVEQTPQITSIDPNNSVELPTSITLPRANSAFFTSKVYDSEIGNAIYYYGFTPSTEDINVSFDDPDWTWGRWYDTGWNGNTQTRNGTLRKDFSFTYTARENGSSGNSNAMMYFVTITQSSDEHKIAHPVTERINLGTTYAPNYQVVTVSSAENDELISPAFMLASQLGAVWEYGLTWQYAREHCANYVETYRMNGQTHKLDDWRLPTSKELEIIVNYQNRAKDVMAEVVAGDWYYISYEYGGDSRNGLGPGSGSSNGTAVRCIRDVLPTDAFLQTNN